MIYLVITIFVILSNVKRGKLGCITHMDTHVFCSIQYKFNIPGLNRFAIIKKGEFVRRQS